MPKTAAIVLAAGQGARMQSDVAKVLHPVAGRPMLLAVLDTLARVKPDRTVVVVAPGMEEVAAIAHQHPLAPQIALQKQALGTAHAVRAAEKSLGRFAGDVLILYGDSPLIDASTLRRLKAARRRKHNPAVVVAGFKPSDLSQYGRLAFDDKGGLCGIIEFRDLVNGDGASDICNSGLMAANAKHLWPLLRKVRCNNAKQEYYLTDLVALAYRAGLCAEMITVDAKDTIGVNSRSELAYAEALMQERLRAAAMAKGVTMVDPATVFLSWDTKLGRDVTIEPNVVIGPGVTVANNARIRAFSHIEGAKISNSAIVGPFARLRPGADIGPDVRIGNFVEVKESRFGAGAKANHLSYIGDAKVGVGANIGAGTITCNYDGRLKHMTEIGAGAFIGSNTALVAPVRIGNQAITGAGSTITRNVPAGALALSRSPQQVAPGWTVRQQKSKNVRQKLSLKSKLRRKS